MAASAAQSKRKPQPCGRYAARRLIIVFACVLAFVTLSTYDAFAITRDAVIARGQSWVDVGVPYSQSRYYAGYRTDCSGFASMCWQTRGSYTTRTLHEVAYPISVNDLRSGDALLKYDSHVRIFAGWVDKEHTRYVALEQTTPGAIQSVHAMASDLAYGYVPYRYNPIQDCPVSWNLVSNSGFEWWFGSTPVWWTANSDAYGTVSRNNRGVVRSGRASLGVVNHSTDPAAVAEVTQSASAEASKTYSLSAWATTNRDPHAVQLRLQFFDASGASLVDTSTTGEKWGLGPSAFKPMNLTYVTPPGAVAAKVSLRLAGGSWIDTTTVGSVTFDDVQFYVSSPMPVYRFYNPRTGAHFYTASGPERDAVIRDYWPAFGYEGVVYAVSTAAANNQDLYRFYNTRTGAHFYTTLAAERDYVLRTWPFFHYEGVAFYLAP